ncbi:hypothetical protein WOLCODRAFT_82054 [Wolfiporia cocos MD-104 SS10]|uniref:Uncharacterized protein n=1 Tax=Wolfiporia cocos (strain MD-104) TaxID=742152 RepID=A0A2H3JHS9_WOLCO|nr:hypothetical protein WOLCODRAFT_82054 [Wolfiporia cocos MD-104 SS10]
MADNFLRKRKAAQSLPVELQRAAKPIFHIQEATALPTSSRTTASVSSGPDLVAPCDVYQTGEDLYSALSSALQSFYDSCASQQQQQRLPYVRFRGMYSIVADPSVPQRKRVTLVSTELRKFVKYPHSCGDEFCASFMTTEKWTGTYQCDCSRGRAYTSHFPSTSQPTSASQSTSQSPASIPSPASSAPPLSQSSAVSASSAKAIRRTQSNLSHWILNTSRKTKPTASSGLGAAPVTFRSGTGQADTMPGCGGRLYIVAEEDESHPLGKAVMGQRITVIVEHPR